MPDSGGKRSRGRLNNSAVRTILSRCGVRGAPRRGFFTYRKFKTRFRPTSHAVVSAPGFVTGPGTLGIIPDGTSGYPQYLPPLRFNNFVTGDPALNTFQPGNTYMALDGFSKLGGPAHVEVRRRIPRSDRRNHAGEEEARILQTSPGSALLSIEETTLRRAALPD